MVLYYCRLSPGPALGKCWLGKKVRSIVVWGTPDELSHGVKDLFAYVAPMPV